jgi:hypothetical protein
MSDLDDNVEQSQKLHIGRAVSVFTGPNCSVIALISSSSAIIVVHAKYAPYPVGDVEEEGLTRTDPL